MNTFFQKVGVWKVGLLVLTVLLTFCTTSFSQKLSRFVITDNLASSVKFGYGKPKPGPAKSRFVILPEHGTQVLCYADIQSDEQVPELYKLKFTAFKMENGKETWVDDRVFDGKKTSTYALIAFNFFETGKYKIVVTGKDEKEILLSGELEVVKE